MILSPETVAEIHAGRGLEPRLSAPVAVPEIIENADVSVLVSVTGDAKRLPVP
jgi:hypothetical protein